jgi:hypothetical protein
MSDNSSATCVATLEGHTNFVTSVAFHPNEPILATDSYLSFFFRALVATSGSVRSQVLRLILFSRKVCMAHARVTQQHVLKYPTFCNLLETRARPVRRIVPSNGFWKNSSCRGGGWLMHELFELQSISLSMVVLSVHYRLRLYKQVNTWKQQAIASSCPPTFSWARGCEGLQRTALRMIQDIQFLKNESLKVWGVASKVHDWSG